MRALSEAIRIPKEFEFDGEAVDIRREGDRLITEAPRSNVPAILAVLDTFETIDEDISIPEELLPLDDGPDFGPNDDGPPTRDVTCLLDANAISDLMRHPHGVVARRLTSVTGDQAITSVVVECEIGFGLARRPSPRLEERWLRLRDAIPIVAGPRAALERAGARISPNDLLIAAHALALEAVVATDHVREFSRVAGLRVGHWLAAEGEAP